MLGTTYDVKAIQTRLYDDPLVQYNKGIDVPFLKPKVFLKQTPYDFLKSGLNAYIFINQTAQARRFIPVHGMENASRTEVDAVTTHIEAFKMQSEKASALISNLFK